MSLIQGIGDEVTNFFIGIIVCTIVYFAWRSTDVREDRIQRAAVLIIDSNNRRRLRRDSQVRQLFTLSNRSQSTESNTSNATEELDLNDENSSTNIPEVSTINEAPSLLSVLDEINNLTASQNINTSDNGAEQIIQEMDRDDNTSNSNNLRRRNVQLFETNSNVETTNETSTESISVDSTDNEMVNNENCSNENNENSNLINQTTKTIRTVRFSDEEEASSNQQNGDENNTEMKIKLKYLNDDMKSVKCFPNEAVGEFKKRNFSVELAARKTVRLVFNGQVLQPDTKTLQSCGIFENCVVHCLIHNRKARNQNENDETNSQDSNESNDGNEEININFAHGQPVNNDRSGPILIYVGMCLICLILLCGWYCRFKYNYLFTWYSTIGLCLITALFILMIPLNILLEREGSAH